MNSYKSPVIEKWILNMLIFFHKFMGKISNLLFLSLFSLSKNWMHNVVWGCAGILPKKIA